MDEAATDLLDQSEKPSHYEQGDDEARNDSDGTFHSIPLYLFEAILGGEGPDVKKHQRWLKWASHDILKNEEWGYDRSLHPQPGKRGKDPS